jgi:concanavalin A-like lectin/glucanase superfamily protein
MKNLILLFLLFFPVSLLATDVTDISGNANNGTYTTGVTQDLTGKFSKALSFDGTGSGVTIPNNASLDLNSNGMTLEAWIYPAQSQTDFVALIVRNTNVYWLYASDSQCGDMIPMGGFDNGTNLYVCDTSSLLLNQWTHLAVTYDGTTLRFYRNGNLTNSNNTSAGLLSGTGTLQIGASMYGENFIGKIDEVRIYNYARSQSEIQSDMNTPLQPLANYVYKYGAATAIKVGAATVIRKGK